MNRSNHRPRLYPLVSVDIALFGSDEQGLKVLLARRAREPAVSQWALPGGVLRPLEDAQLVDAARRVLRDKLAVSVPQIEQIRVFSGADRDPRGWSIAVLFAALVPREQVNAVVKTQVQAVEWFSLQELPPMAFDHAEQLSAALTKLRTRVESYVLPLHLMPERFTLTDLQRTCEAILGRTLDKSVFRRRLKGSTDIIELDEYQGGAQRPARFYRAREGFDFTG
ncbi:MAG: NUDIX hydrolase [Burkholderiaceae bacterium]|jgi:ADP-ribose pyrophosphatase YjhB (NUDIX family)|nr:NUDIX hydrolase [Burkholderiaceae bacterium]